MSLRREGVLAVRGKVNRPRIPWTALPSAGSLCAIFSLALGLSFTYYWFRWSIGPDNYFFADDWTHFWYAEFTPRFSTFVKDVLTAPWPYSRPVGSLFIAVMYSAFGLNAGACHAILLLVHLVNVLLVFEIASTLFQSRGLGVCTALLFGNYLIACIGAVTWIGAAFDLVCCFFCLLSLKGYTSKTRTGAVLALLFYLVALRTKQMAVLLPIVFLLFELCGPGPKSFRKCFQRVSIPLILMTIAGCTAFYVTRYSADRLAETDSYHMTFTGAAFTQGLGYYLSSLVYAKELEPAACVAVYGALLLLAVGFRRRLILFGAVGFLASLLPVVFIPGGGHRDTLYLYLPSVFFSVLMTAAAVEIAGLFGFVVPWLRRRLSVLRVIAASAVAASVIVCGMSSRPLYIAFSANLARMNRDAVEFLHSRHLAPDATIVVRGVPEYSNVFSYHDGWAVQVVCRSRNIKVIVEMDPTSAVPKNAVYVTYRGGVYREGID
jgi:hypothetical protein